MDTLLLGDHPMADPLKQQLLMVGVGDTMDRVRWLMTGYGDYGYGRGSEYGGYGYGGQEGEGLEELARECGLKLKNR